MRHGKPRHSPGLGASGEKDGGGARAEGSHVTGSLVMRLMENQWQALSLAGGRAGGSRAGGWQRERASAAGGGALAAPGADRPTCQGTELLSKEGRGFPWVQHLPLRGHDQATSLLETPVSARNATPGCAAAAALASSVASASSAAPAALIMASKAGESLCEPRKSCHQRAAASPPLPLASQAFERKCWKTKMRSKMSELERESFSNWIFSVTLQVGGYKEHGRRRRRRRGGRSGSGQEVDWRRQREGEGSARSFDSQEIRARAATRSHNQKIHQQYNIP